jgi:hypothetical protein
MKTKKKSKKPKARIKVAPPQSRHKSKKDYDRKKLEKDLNKSLEKLDLDDMVNVEVEICSTPTDLNACLNTEDKLYKSNTHVIHGDLISRYEEDLKQELVEQAREENKYAGGKFQEFMDEMGAAVKNQNSFWQKIKNWFKK